MVQATLTSTDPAGRREWALDDEVICLREWGTERAHVLPTAPAGEWMIGSSSTCTIRVVDPSGHTSREHARLVRDRSGWTMRDARSKNGLWVDDARRDAFQLVPGIEIGIGNLRLIAESVRSILLRAFLGRALGWSSTASVDVDRAMRVIHNAATLRAPIVLRGAADVLYIARELHDRVFGREVAFSVVDTRRTRSLGVDEARIVAGGTLCVWLDRLPSGFQTERQELLERGTRGRLILCGTDKADQLDLLGASIRIPSLSERAHELPRIIDEYAHDAVLTLAAKPSSFTAMERDWLIERRPATLSEIARSVERLVAIREWGNLTQAASRLGISHVALSRWLSRRR